VPQNVIFTLREQLFHLETITKISTSDFKGYGQFTVKSQEAGKLVFFKSINNFLTGLFDAL
jgi:hypothetical protein